MHSFKDQAGTEWQLDSTFVAAERVKTATGIDLYKLHENNLAGLDALLHDPPKLIAVAWEMTRGTAYAKSVTDFKAALDVDAMDRLSDAFVEAWIDGQPGKDRRAALRKLVGTFLTMSAEFSRAAAENLDAATMKAIEKLRATPLAEIMGRIDGGK